MTPDAPAADAEPRIPCYACAEPVHPDARKCRWCGEWYSDIGWRRGGLAPSMTAAEAPTAYARSIDELRPSPGSAFEGRLVLRRLELVSGEGLVDGVDASFEDVRDTIAETYGIAIPFAGVRHDPEFETGIHVFVREVHAGHVAAEGDVARALLSIVERHLHDLVDRSDVERAARLAGVALQAGRDHYGDSQDRIDAVTMTQVVRRLLRERVPVRDLVRIAETVQEATGQTKDPDALTERARSALRDAIVTQVVGTGHELAAVCLAPDLERLLAGSIQLVDGGYRLELDRDARTALLGNLADALHDAGTDVVLVVPSRLRRHIREEVAMRHPDLRVLAFSEIPDRVAVREVATLDADRLREGDEDIHPDSRARDRITVPIHSNWLMQPGSSAEVVVDDWSVDA